MKGEQLQSVPINANYLLPSNSWLVGRSLQLEIWTVLLSTLCCERLAGSYIFHSYSHIGTKKLLKYFIWADMRIRTQVTFIFPSISVSILDTLAWCSLHAENDSICPSHQNQMLLLTLAIKLHLQSWGSEHCYCNLLQALMYLLGHWTCFILKCFSVLLVPFCTVFRVL